jgi:hypothetical protein
MWGPANLSHPVGRIQIMNSIERRAKQMLAMHGPETEQEVLMRIDAALRYSNRLEADFWRRILEAVKRLAR